MKKLFTAISVVLCAVLLTMQFFAAPKASSIISHVLGKMDGIKSIDYTTKDKTIFTVDNEKMNFTRNTRYKVLYKGRNSADISMKITDSYGSKYDVYYKDGYVYQNLYGIKGRQKVNYMPGDPVDSFMLALPPDVLRSAVVTEEDGVYKIVAKVPSDVLTKNWEEYKEYLNSVLKEDGYRNIQIAFSDYRVTYRVEKNGQLKSVTNAYALSVSSDKENLGVQYIQTHTINSTDKLTSVSFPADLSSYTTY